MTEETTEQVVEPEVIEEPAKKPVVVKQTKESPATAKTMIIRDKEDAILELRKENEKLRKNLEEVATERAEKLAKEQIDAAKAAAKVDAEKLVSDRVTELEERSRTRIMKSELKAAAMRAGVIDFDDLFQIMQRDTIKEVKFTDDGDVENATELVAEMKKNKAHLFGGVNTTSTTQVPPARQQNMEKTALDMNAEEYKKARSRLAAM